MGVALAAYRAVTAAVGALAPMVRSLAPRGSATRAAWTGASDEIALASGSVWIHAASMGEVVSARNWVHALLEAGGRPPFLLTTRTQRGLDRARRELGERVVARVAPLDAPQLLRSFLAAAAPWRLDIVETEIWPQLILESRRAGVGVVFVSAAVSERTRRHLLRWGFAGPRLLGDGVWVLAQSEEHAGRFGSLGVPAERIAVVGDLKAEAPSAGAARDPAARGAVVFGSLRPGEEDVALALAKVLSTRDRAPVFLVAPRHQEGVALVTAKLRSAGIEPLVRDERDRAREEWAAWLLRVEASPAPRVGVVATQGELPAAYEAAGIAIVGGTFAAFGGHNVLEPAARGCAVIVGPHHEAVALGVSALRREEGVVIAETAEAAAAAVGRLLDSPDVLRRVGAGAARATREASSAARRAVLALGRFGLMP
jgi:3-deoxy-D-manno-octulosonic-acid transferase